MSDLNAELLTREVMDRLEGLNCDSSFTELDGEPFCIVEGWGELSKINQVLNEVHRPELWAKWEPVYKSAKEQKLAADAERWGQANRWEVANPDTYGQLRIPTGVDRDGNPGAPYLVPDGLIELDQVMEWGFSDEYTTCSECYAALRTSPDSYMWQMRGYCDGNGIYCEQCTKDDPEAYADHYMNRNALINEDLINLEAEGWTDLELSMESGYHHGQNDDPRLLLELRRRFLHGVADFVFTGNVGQFDIAFTLWVKPAPFCAEDRGGWADNPEIFAKLCRRMITRGYTKPLTGISDAAQRALEGMSTASRVQP